MLGICITKSDINLALQALAYFSDSLEFYYLTNLVIRVHQRKIQGDVLLLRAEMLTVLFWLTRAINLKNNGTLISFRHRFSLDPEAFSDCCTTSWDYCTLSVQCTIRPQCDPSSEILPAEVHKKFTNCRINLQNNTIRSLLRAATVPAEISQCLRKSSDDIYPQSIYLFSEVCILCKYIQRYSCRQALFERNWHTHTHTCIAYVSKYRRPYKYI